MRTAMFTVSDLSPKSQSRTSDWRREAVEIGRFGLHWTVRGSIASRS
jgi:hypothetical protein